MAENVSIDALQTTINNYLQVYESQLYDDFGYKLSCRQRLDHVSPKYVRFNCKLEQQHLRDEQQSQK